MNPTRMRTGLPFEVRARASSPTRSRGLAHSSIPKLSSASAVPRMAMAIPAGTNHHQAPCASACWLSAENRMVPQFQSDIPGTPMKASVISAITANITVPMKLAATGAIRLGMISNPMSRHAGSPTALAAST